MTQTEIKAAVAAQAAALAGKIGTMKPTDRRLVVAVAGPPGSGKSTLAEALVEALIEAGRKAVVMPMDGFHLDDRILIPAGLRPRKGAPETFDFGGFSATVARLKTDDRVFLPVFDRSREIAIAGAAEITPDTEIVVVEGNYLVLDEAPWNGLAGLWDYAVYLDVPVAELERRLIARWLGYGFDRAGAEEKALGNDIPNARRVAGAVARVDERVTG